jgi:hypothetical protein
MKSFIGFALIISGLLVGAYVGIWLAFIGGIIDVIHEIRAPDLSAINIAIGIAKIFFASAIAYLSALPMMVTGFALAK